MRVLHRRASWMLLASLFLLTNLLHADATRQDWIGDFAMDHDGHVGTLHLASSLRKCAAPCAGLDAQYSDANGTHPTTVDALDQNGQHLAFSVAFPGNLQRFDVYIFSFDKSRLAGTTVWQGRTFGVTASRTGVSSAIKVPSGSAVPKKTLGADGSLVVQNSDGSTVSHHIGRCGNTTVLPNGRVIRSECMDSQVITLVPPDPPTGTNPYKWLRSQDDALLVIIQTIMDSTSFQNYLSNYENPPDPAIYKQINLRTKTISDFLSLQ